MTGSTHLAPRGDVLLTLTGDGKTLLSGGGWNLLRSRASDASSIRRSAGRTVSMYDSTGQLSSSTAFVNSHRGRVAKSAQHVVEC